VNLGRSHTNGNARGKRKEQLGMVIQPEDSTHRVLVWLLEVGIGRPYKTLYVQKGKVVDDAEK
jgi:hypothetical protein